MYTMILNDNKIKRPLGFTIMLIISTLIFILIILVLWAMPEYSFTVTKTGESRIDTIRRTKGTRYYYVFKTKEYKNTEFNMRIYYSDSLVNLLKNGDKIFVQTTTNPKYIGDDKTQSIHTIKTRNVCIENESLVSKIMITIGFTVFLLMCFSIYIFKPEWTT